mgnify:CR=1 FL=1
MLLESKAAFARFCAGITHDHGPADWAGFERHYAAHADALVLGPSLFGCNLPDGMERTDDARYVLAVLTLVHNKMTDGRVAEALGRFDGALVGRLEALLSRVAEDAVETAEA